MTLRTRRSLFAAIAIVLAAACPLKKPPTSEELREQSLPEAPPDRPWAETAQAGPVAADWLATFHDAELSALVQEAMAHNLDLAVGAARVEQAAAQIGIAKSRLWPQVSILGRGSTKLSDDFSTGLSGGIFSVSWELDLWGRVRYGKAAATENLAASESDFVYARQSIAAATAKSWFMTAETELERRLFDQLVADADQLVQLATTRVSIGSGDESAVAVARASAESYREGASQLDLASGQARRALELLVGRYPTAQLQARSDLPALPPPIPAGLPLEMLERRPDLIAAERRVAAAFNRVGEAKAARLPTIALTASGGYLTSNTLELKDDYENPSAGIGASLVAPLYTGGALKGTVALRTAEQKQSVAEYARMALRSIGEVEDALAGERVLGDRERALVAVVSENERALSLAETAQRIGRSDQRAVLDRRLVLTSARIALLRVQAERLSQRVDLHLALGGSFEPAPPPPESSESAAAAPAGR